jgi:predicted Rossmann-fold nucleotide-binding protein
MPYTQGSKLAQFQSGNNSGAYTGGMGGVMGGAMGGATGNPLDVASSPEAYCICSIEAVDQTKSSMM